MVSVKPNEAENMFPGLTLGGGGRTQACFPFSRWLAAEFQDQRAGEEWEEDGASE